MARLVHEYTKSPAAYQWPPNNPSTKHFNDALLNSMDKKIIYVMLLAKDYGYIFSTNVTDFLEEFRMNQKKTQTRIFVEELTAVALHPKRMGQWTDDDQL
jgi:hypothetical protein